MTGWEVLFVLLGVAVSLALVFPRPKRRVKDNPKFYTVPPKVITPVKILNQIDRFFQDFLGRPLIPVNESKLLEIARATPKSELFGPQEPLIEAIKKFAKGFRESKPTAFGVFANNRYRLINLQKRTQVMEYIIKNPSVAQIPISRPIIITGMMRTGSTLLFNLLDQDPDARSPYLWEMAGTNPNPTPPPKSKDDPRSAEVDKAIQTYKTFIPSLLTESAKSHKTGAFDIEECLFVLIHQQIHQVILPLAGRDYLEWFLSDKDKEYAYIYLKRYLQLLSSGYNPKSHWSLKAPIHSLYISHLIKQFPDALVVITHRNPIEVVPSTCKLFETGTYFHYEENTLDRRWIGECCMRMSETMCNRIMDYREAHGSERFHDVRYPDLLEDPIGTVRKIYAQAGKTVSPQFEENMKRYMEQNPQGKHGRNKYDLESFGLNQEQFDAAFEKYRKTYGI